MSETAFPFGDDEDVAEASRDNKKLFVALAGVVVLALVGAFVVLPALSGDAADDVVVAAQPARTAPKVAVKPVPAAPKKATPVTATFNDTVGRDPFRPLYVAPAAGGLAAPGGSFVPPAQPEPGVNPAPDSQPQSSSTQVGGNRVALLDVFTRDGKVFAQTKVGDTVHTPVVGSTFATSYQLLTASGECATYLFGDENFQLCEGQEVLK